MNDLIDEKLTDDLINEIASWSEFSSGIPDRLYTPEQVIEILESNKWFIDYVINKRTD